ncbi:MAG: hypothetical protein LUH82_07390 [Clostridiales bacterium]|nr:hypothetical protein [Clostridiales bacterium]
MAEKKEELFTAPRWNDTQIPRVTGHVEFTEEEKRQAEINMKKWLVEIGVMKETDEFDESNEIDYDNLDEYAKKSIERTKALRKTH